MSYSVGFSFFAIHDNGIFASPNERYSANVLPVHCIPHIDMFRDNPVHSVGPALNIFLNAY
jgi:hypothetical protein